MLCLVCDRREATKPQVCDSCRTRIGLSLWEIRDMYAELPAFVAANGIGNGPKVSGTKAKPIPVRLDVIDLLAPARAASVHGDAKDQAGYASVATVLDSWVRDWRDTLFPQSCLPSASVGGLIPWLRNRLDMACDHHGAIGDFATEVIRLHSALMRVTERVSSEVDEDSVAQKLDAVKMSMFTECGRFTMPENGQRSSGQSIHLDALLTAKMAAMLAGVTTMTISNWRKANKLTPAQFDSTGHAQYRVGDVLAVANKR